MPNPHITVPDEPTFQETAVTASQDTFGFTFTFFHRDDLRVSVNDEELDDEDFEVTGTSGFEGGYPGGTVILDVAVTSSVVKIWRDIPPVRLKDFLEGGGFRATPVNTEIDKLTARQQDNLLRFQRITTLSSSISASLVASDMGTLRTNKAASGATELTLPEASAGLHAWFAVVNAQAFTISVGGEGDVIHDDGETGTSMASSTIGSIFHLIGTDEGTWVVDSKNGTWVLS